eukprot:5756725-Pyramimonas_sp.AAC.1
MDDASFVHWTLLRFPGGRQEVRYAGSMISDGDAWNIGDPALHGTPGSIVMCRAAEPALLQFMFPKRVKSGPHTHFHASSRDSKSERRKDAKRPMRCPLAG